MNAVASSLLESPQCPLMELTTPKTWSGTQVSARCPVRFIHRRSETRPQLPTRRPGTFSQSERHFAPTYHLRAGVGLGGTRARPAFYYSAAPRRVLVCSAAQRS